ncbi:MAG: site-specific integrase [Thermoguttaceae bacterium]
MTPITRFRFSKQRVEALPIPADGRAEYRDITTPGLVLRVTATGARSFSLFRRVNGRPARVTLGAFPAMTVEQAQRRARELQGQIVMGIDPRTARRKAREEPTLSVLFQFWMDTHAKLHKRTWEADQRQYDSYLKPWAGRALSAIKKADVAALQLRIAEKKGRYIANKVLALLRAMFNRAGDIGFDGPNPTAGIKKFPEEKRDRFLHGDDLRLFFAALASDPNGELRDYFLVCLFVGARKSNVLAMRWEEIDFATGLWRIPTTKSGQPVVVPLVGPVLRLLEARKQASNGSPWVFPSRGRTGHIVEPKSAWKRIIERAGLSDVRPHDLRRSLGSWMAITGSSLPVVGKMLGHSQPTTTAIYARLSTDPVRAAAEAATSAMLQAGGVKMIDVQAEKGANSDEV